MSNYGDNGDKEWRKLSPELEKFYFRVRDDYHSIDKANSVWYMVVVLFNLNII